VVPALPGMAIGDGRMTLRQYTVCSPIFSKIKAILLFGFFLCVFPSGMFYNSANLIQMEFPWLLQVCLL
jgi:hypothetical protein